VQRCKNNPINDYDSTILYFYTITGEFLCIIQNPENPQNAEIIMDNDCIYFLVTIVGIMNGKIIKMEEFEKLQQSKDVYNNANISQYDDIKQVKKRIEILKKFIDIVQNKYILANNFDNEYIANVTNLFTLYEEIPENNYKNKYLKYKKNIWLLKKN
jgi:hypothetical protein